MRLEGAAIELGELGGGVGALVFCVEMMRMHPLRAAPHNSSLHTLHYSCTDPFLFAHQLLAVHGGPREGLGGAAGIVLRRFRRFGQHVREHGFVGMGVAKGRGKCTVQASSSLF